MKTLLTFILSLFTLGASAATTNYLATTTRTNATFFLSDTNVITVGSGIWTWTTTVGLFRSNIMSLGGVTGPLNVAGLTNTAQTIQTTELDVQNILPKGTAMSIYAGSSSGNLYDFANVISVDFKSRKLYDAAQNQIVDFSNTNSLDFQSAISARLFSGPGSGLTLLPAGQLTGSIADARLSGNVSLLGQTISESEQALSDVTTANATTSAHGYLKKLDGNAAHYMDGSGLWSSPSSSAFPLTANANGGGWQVTNLWGIGFSNSASMTTANTDKGIVTDATHFDVNGEGRFDTIVATGGVSSVSSLTPGILVLSSTNPANVGFSVPTNSTVNYTNVYKGAFPFAPGHCWVVETTNGNFIVWTNGPCPGGSSASVGGAKPQVQFNNGGSLSGTTNMTWDQTNSALTITPPSGAPTNNIGPTTITGGAQVTTTFAAGPGASQSESLGVGGNGDFTGWTISTQSLARMNLFLLATNANTLGVSNILVTPFNSQYVDLHATNALTWTNYANFASTNAGYAAWRVAPEVINRTNLWLLGKGSGVNILTNIGLPLYPTFTNGISYMVEFSWWGTNILVSTKAISQ